ncbi:MAG: hypothetical protein J0M12_05155 [Deltaproteobacteria bacterium]|nr:hypothetical protein [Deltaproteobacteria bacterium]
MIERTGGELIPDFLETFDIPYVFGNPGTTETTFLAAVAKSKASYILALHESSAASIAAGYALITGKPSVVSLHTYPGLANGMFNMRNALILGMLKNLDVTTHIVTEGSSEDAIVQDMAVALGFQNVHFLPRGGGLGWAMPLGVGIGLATGKHAVCFVGDGGSLFSIHAIRRQYALAKISFVEGGGLNDEIVLACSPEDPPPGYTAQRKID